MLTDDDKKYIQCLNDFLELYLHRKSALRTHRQLKGDLFTRMSVVATYDREWILTVEHNAVTFDQPHIID